MDAAHCLRPPLRRDHPRDPDSDERHLPRAPANKISVFNRSPRRGWDLPSRYRQSISPPRPRPQAPPANRACGLAATANARKSWRADPRTHPLRRVPRHQPISDELPSGRTAEYSYVRYFFSNLSEDIRRIFIEHCELLGIRVTQSNHRNLSVSHRNSVAILEELVGPKT